MHNTLRARRYDFMHQRVLLSSAKLMINMQYTPHAKPVSVLQNDKSYIAVAKTISAIEDRPSGNKIRESMLTWEFKLARAYRPVNTAFMLFMVILAQSLITMPSHAANPLAASPLEQCADRGGTAFCVPAVPISSWFLTGSIACVADTAHYFRGEGGNPSAAITNFFLATDAFLNDPANGCGGESWQVASTVTSFACDAQPYKSNVCSGKSCYASRAACGYTKTSTNIQSGAQSTYPGALGASQLIDCPAGSNLFFTIDEVTGDEISPAVCVFRTNPKNLGRPCGSEGCGDPIHIGTGNKYQGETDFVGVGTFPLTFVRHYNSVGAFAGSMGKSWRMTYDRSISPPSLLGASPKFYAFRADGKTLGFSPLGNGYVGDADIKDQMNAVVNSSGVRVGWKYVIGATEEIEIYDQKGRLQSITNRLGLSQTLTYDPAGRLILVTDSFGRQLGFTYDPGNRINSMVDPVGQATQYTYDALGNLTAATFPDGTYRTYLYNEVNLSPSNVGTPLLTGIVDENLQRFATFTYVFPSWATYPMATSSVMGAGVDTAAISYTADGSRIVTDALGKGRVYTFDNSHGTSKTSALSEPCSNCGNNGLASKSFDANGNLSVTRDFIGWQTSRAYDLSRNLEVRRVEGLGGSGEAISETRMTTSEWNTRWRLRSKIAEPSRVTSYVYNGDTVGGQQVFCAPISTQADGLPIATLCSKTVQATNDVTGSGGLSAAPVGTARTWRYTYDSLGKMVSAIGPRNDVPNSSTYTYHTVNDPSGRYRVGDLATTESIQPSIGIARCSGAGGVLVGVLDGRTCDQG